VLYLQLRTAGLQAALTLCFTTFVLFQLFNIFNARAEHGTTFTRDLFGNPLLWASLAGVLGLQALAVHWGPAQDIFGTTDLSAAQWLLSTAVASSVLLLEEARKALALLAARFSSRTAQQPRA